jgi:hypothetical protein
LAKKPMIEPFGVSSCSSSSRGAELGREHAHAGEIAAWTIKTGDESQVDGIATDDEDDRYCAARILRGQC